MIIRLDDSLGELARYAAPLAGAAALAVLAAAWLYAREERRSRAAWREVPVRVARAGHAYRSSTFVAAQRERAPRAARAASLGSFAFGNLFVPGILFALGTFPFDGIGVPLVSGVVLSLAIWACGFIVLQPTSRAREIVRTAAVTSLLHNVALLVMTALHLAMVEMRSAGPVHECSASIVLTCAVYAAAAIPQALLMLAAVPASRAPAPRAFAVEPSPAE